MKAKSGPHKDTRLLRGDAAKIARIHRVTRQHVLECAKGTRPGRRNLTETIRRYQEKAQLVAANHTDAASAA